jgi:hypothetical protein
MTRFLTVFVLAVLAGGSSRALDVSLDFLQIPAVYQFVQTNVATGVSGQESKDVPMPTFGLRVSQSLPQLFADWPLSIGFETGFGLPAGTSSFDERERFINSSSLSANARNEGDSVEFSALAVPIMAVIGYTPHVSGVSIGGQAGIGVVMMDLRGSRMDSVYTGPLDDLDYVDTTHGHEIGATLAVQLAGGLVVPVTETLSARLWGGAIWMSQADFSSERRMADGSTTVEGLQVGGVGFTVRAGLSSSL